MPDPPPADKAWVCPFCGAVATLLTPRGVVSASRTCSCGAIGLAAPMRDLDEIVDDAINLFQVTVRGESRGYDALLLDDIRRSRVEIRTGEAGRAPTGLRQEYQSLWFRRPTEAGLDDGLPDGAPGQAAESRYCSRCGRVSAQGSLGVCQACGGERPVRGPNITEWLCAACHRGTPGDPRYCEWCGASFG
jgi:RNA polymerase subunit RPABC4/transcription elongation factor Spt4